jgi:hypothetical protein
LIFAASPSNGTFPSNTPFSTAQKNPSGSRVNDRPSVSYISVTDELPTIQPELTGAVEKRSRDQHGVVDLNINPCLCAHIFNIARRHVLAILLHPSRHDEKRLQLIGDIRVSKIRLHTPDDFFIPIQAGCGDRFVRGLAWVFANRSSRSLVYGPTTMVSVED